MRKIAGTSAAVALLLLGLSACGGGGDGGDGGDGGSDEVKIGVLVSETGTFSAIGQPEAGAINLAVERINENGGIEVDGKNYTFKIYKEDVASDPATANTKAKALIQDEGIRFVFGPSETPEAVGVQPVTAQAQALWFTPSLGVAESLSADGPDTDLNRYTYSVGMPSAAANQTIVDGITQLEPEAKTITVLWPDLASFDNQVKSMESTLKENGFDVLDVVRYDATTTDFSPILTQVRADNPDVIWAGTTAPAVGAVQQQMASLGMNDKVLVASGGASANAKLASGQVSPFPVIYPTNGGLDPNFDDPEIDALYADYEKYNGEAAPTTNVFWPLEVTGVDALAAAMEKAGSVSDIKKIQEALLEITVNPPLGEFQFEENHLAKIPNTLCRAEGGEISCIAVEQK